MPVVVLTASRNDQVLQIHPGLSNQVGLFIVVENRNLQLVVVGGLVDRKSEFVVPVVQLASAGQ